MGGEVLTVKGLAARLDVSTATIYRRVEDGLLTPMNPNRNGVRKAFRFSWSEVREQMRPKEKRL